MPHSILPSSSPAGEVVRNITMPAAKGRHHGPGYKYPALLYPVGEYPQRQAQQKLHKPVASGYYPYHLRAGF